MPKPNKAYVYLMMIGHICVDTCQGALAATLPFLVLYNDFSYANATMLIFGANLASAIIQPLFGVLGDRKARPWLMALGVFLSGLGMFGIGFLDSFAMVVVSAVVCGMGIAMFHPEGGRVSNLVSGADKAGGMSIFAVGGNIGFCIGPIIAAAALTTWGMKGTWVFLAMCAVVAIVILTRNAKLAAYGVVDKKAVEATGGKDHWGAFSLLMGVLSLRSMAFYGMTTFVPLFMVSVLGQSEGVGSMAISAYAAIGAVATFTSGKISNKVGVLRLLALSLGVMTVCLAAFVFTRSVVVAVALAGVIGFCICTFYPSTVAYAQGLTPSHLGTASGLTYGVAIAIGGITSPILGDFADSAGIAPVFAIMSGVCLIAMALALVLMRMAKRLHTANPNTKTR